jgi:hypothetical protein
MRRALQSLSKAEKRARDEPIATWIPSPRFNGERVRVRGSGDHYDETSAPNFKYGSA